MKLKTYQIRYNPILVPDGNTTGIIEGHVDIEVQGVDVYIHSGIAGDYLHIKHQDRSVVFAANINDVKWCKIRDLKNQLKVIKHKGVTINEDAVHLLGRKNKKPSGEDQNG
jgi:hypothetical protein